MVIPATAENTSSAQLMEQLGRVCDSRGLPDLATRFHRWIEQQTTAVHLVVVGGGALVEVVRDYDQQHAMDAAQVHWLCVDLLDVTARLAAQLLKLDLVETDQQLAMRK